MTNQQHPITPPPELVQQWTDAYWGEPGQYVGIDDEALATRAAQWGADQELEACCEWVKSKQTYWAHDELRATRRPKPPSLKEQALDALELVKQRTTDPKIIEPLRRALEQLDD